MQDANPRGASPDPPASASDRIGYLVLGPRCPEPGNRHLVSDPVLVLMFGIILSLSAWSVSMAGVSVGSGPEIGLGAVARRHAAQLAAFGPRVPGSTAHERAQNYIVETLRAQSGWWVRVEPFTVGAQRYVNVVAVWPEPVGASGWLFSAHYDTVPPSPGALDNATSVGLLLALAEHWSRHRPPRPVVLGFWDGEEAGLLGSTVYARRYAAGETERLPRLIGHVSLEMVGWSRGTACFHTFRYPWGPTSAPHPLAPAWLLRHVLQTARAAGLMPRFGDPILSYPYQWAVRNVGIPFASDDAPFSRVGVPSVFVADASFARFYPAYHTAADRIEAVSVERLDRYARWLLRVVETPPPEPVSDRDQAYWVFGSRVLSGTALRWALAVLGALYAGLAVAAPGPPVVRWGRLLVPLGLALGKPSETLALLIPATLLASLGHLRTDPTVARLLSIPLSLVYWSGPLLTFLAMLRFPGLRWTAEGLLVTSLMLIWFLLLPIRG